MQADYETAQRARRAPDATTVPAVHTPPLPQQMGAALLGDSRLGGRGNGPLRAAAIQQMQQTQGNRAVQRFYRHSSRPGPFGPALPVQRQPDGPDNAPTPDMAVEGTEANSSEESEDAEEYGDLQSLAAFAAEQGGGSETDSSDEDSTVQTARSLQRVAVQCGKPKSRRDIALGRTPGKGTAVGRKVLERWDTKGKARWVGSGTANHKQPNKWEVYVRNKAGTRTWMTLDGQIHMGHKLAAVDYWEKGAKGGITKPKHKLRYKDFLSPGFKSGFKGKQNRKFMLHDPNYRFEYGPANSSAGGMMKERYTTLPTGKTKWPT